MSEQIPKTIGFKAGERNVFFHILTACNLSCSHCYINPTQHGSNTLDKDTIIQWLMLFARPDKVTTLILLGGEPTLHPDLPEIIKIATKMNYAVTVDSNGYLHHNLLEKIKPEELDYLSFSLDGPTPEVNDPIRGEGVFDVCTKNIKEAVAKGFRVSLICTVSGKNIAHLPQMVDLLVELKIKRFFIQVIGLRGESAKKEATGLQVERQDWFSMVPRVATSAAEHGIHVTWPKVFLSEGEVFSCACNVAENFFVFPNGRVYSCPLCEDHPVHGHEIVDGILQKTDGLTETSFFALNIAEGCVMNKLLQPDNISYKDGKVENQISCCMLKQEIVPS
ncbi:MAG: radical SAM protein [Desulfotalea sp.]